MTNPDQRSPSLLTRPSILTDAVRAAALLCAVVLWNSTGATASWFASRSRSRRGDRGASIVEYLALAVGGVLIAGAVVAILRERSQEMANNVCTNADPTTC